MYPFTFRKHEIDTSGRNIPVKNWIKHAFMYFGIRRNLNFWEYSMVSIYFHHIHHFLFQHVSFLFLSHLVEHEPLRSRFSAICQPQEEFCIILCLLSWFSSCKSSSQRYLANSPSLDCIFRFTSEGNNPIRHPLVYNHDHNRYHLLYIKLVEKF